VRPPSPTKGTRPDRQPLRDGSGQRERDAEHHAVHEHHDAKTHGLWRLSYDPDSAIKTWTSPLGKTYTVGTDPVLTGPSSDGAEQYSPDLGPAKCRASLHCAV
jgi:YD repeat-containing protein